MADADKNTGAPDANPEYLNLKVKSQVSQFFPFKIKTQAGWGRSLVQTEKNHESEETYGRLLYETRPEQLIQRPFFIRWRTNHRGQYTWAAKDGQWGRNRCGGWTGWRQILREGLVMSNKNMVKQGKKALFLSLWYWWANLTKRLKFLS